MDTIQLAVLSILGDSDKKKAREITAVLMKKGESKAAEIIDRAVDSFGEEAMRSLGPTSAELAAFIEDPDMIRRRQALMEAMLENGIHVAHLWSTDYPSSLLAISEPPPLLYYIGDLRHDTPKVAIVGTRDASSNGLGQARIIASELASQGVCVVAGLALGIDAAAHTAALDADGDTIAILGSDLGHIYPRENKQLARNIVGHGAVVSEVTELASMHKARFLRRNRITSGISDAILAIETRKEGGTVAQIKTALEQGRPCFVLDQGTSFQSEYRDGFEHLIGLGATALRTSRDLLIAVPKLAIGVERND